MIRGSAWKALVSNTVNDIQRNHTFAFAAGLAYYFVLSLFPSLILLAAVLVLLPIPDLFGRILNTMSKVIPPDGMGLVRQITATVISPNRGVLFSFGLIGVLWSVTSGFSAMIEALNVAYDVPETRPFWKIRAVALLMALGVGGLFMTAVGVQIVGPDFGRWLAHHLGLGPLLRIIWPYLRWGVTAGFTIIAIVATYKVAPNVRQRLRQILPGALFAAVCWILLSFGLGVYFQNFAHFNKTYGTLGAAIALLVWFDYTGLVILVGASVNSQLIQSQGDGRLELKYQPRKAAAEEEPEISKGKDVAA